LLAKYASHVQAPHNETVLTVGPAPPTQRPAAIIMPS
jgi:hypothetical protein